MDRSSDCKLEVYMILRNYIYLDEEAINGLYNQIHSNVIEKSITATQTKINEAEGSVGTQALLKNIVSVDGKYNHQSNNIISADTKMTITVEQKANSLIKEISKDQCAYLKDIIDSLNGSPSKIFVGKALFRLAEVYDEHSTINNFNDINKRFYNTNPSLLFECGDYSLDVGGRSDDDENKYGTFSNYDKMPYGVSMQVGGGKIRQNIRHLTDHINLNRKFLFSVFGEIYYNIYNMYSIKPLAIWRSDNE